LGYLYNRLGKLCEVRLGYVRVVTKIEEGLFFLKFKGELRNFEDTVFEQIDLVAFLRVKNFIMEITF
jgi:hypothetical protein